MAVLSTDDHADHPSQVSHGCYRTSCSCRRALASRCPASRLDPYHHGLTPRYCALKSNDSLLPTARGHYYRDQILVFRTGLCKSKRGEVRSGEPAISAPHVERDGECGAHGGREGAAAGRRAGGRQSGAFRCEESHYFVYCAGMLGSVFLLVDGGEVGIGGWDEGALSGWCISTQSREDGLRMCAWYHRPGCRRVGEVLSRGSMRC
jgi:hypothetical protein